MIEWIAQVPAFAASVAIVFVPGLVVGLVLRVRGLSLWALAPAMSVAILTGSALGMGLAGLPWRPWSAIVAIVVVSALAFAARLVIRPQAAPRIGGRRGRLLLVLGVVAGVILTALRVGLYIGAPSAISQTNDASFHLNALRFAVETGVASPLQLTSMIGAGSFYPSAWHVIASLVVQVSGASVEVAANMTSLAFAAVVWPLGVALLTRAVGGSTAAAFAAAAASAIPAFPLLMLQWGVLYPQLVAVAVLPATLALLMVAPQLAHARRAGWVVPVVLLGAGLAAIAFAQPSVLLAWIVAAWSFALWEIVRRWRGMSAGHRRVAVAALVTAGATATLLWLFFGRSIDGTWPPSTGIATAVLEVVVNGHLGYPWAVGISILALIGLVEAARRPHLRWLAMTWIVFAALYVVAAAVGIRLVRAFLVDPWYDDPYRLAALLPVVVLPLAGLGAATVVRWAAGALGGDGRVGAVVAVVVVVVTGVLSLVAAPQIERRDVFAHRIDPNLYRVTADSFLSEDELAVLERLDQSVPADAVVIGNPGTGMSFGYAVSGRNVVPRTWSPPPSAEYAILWESLRDVASDPEVCTALNAFGSRYVLDFGPGEEYPGRWIMPGFDGIEGQAGFELVDRQGDAALWRVTACD